MVHNGRTLRARHVTPRRQAVVLTAGRLWDEAKNLRTLDAAAAGIRWPVLAAGPTRGPDGQEIRLEHVVALGTLDGAALEDRLRRASVFASLAIYEPFGLAVLEAALAGCALVLSDTATFRELWQDAALFVPPDDPRRGARRHQPPDRRAATCGCASARGRKRAPAPTRRKPACAARLRSTGGSSGRPRQRR